MLKKPLRYLCFSFFILISACAPARVAVKPPEYPGKTVTMQEIVLQAGGGVDALKAITDVRIERLGEPYDFLNASILIRRPGTVHTRVYKFGILVKDFVVTGGELYMLAGKEASRLKEFSNEMYNAVFWWDGLEESRLSRSPDELLYVIETGEKRIFIDEGTLLPVRQELFVADTKVDIYYGKPEQGEDGYWYQSMIYITLGEFSFEVKLKKLKRNPSLTEYDFRIPVKG
ncbi:MAG: hypothetical protein ISR96_02925 [Nitrospira sp.]|nr:hypothetical protein [bacterium]MBL7048467.1 hypothetical protein [Nitrospira sp.]